MFNDLRRASYQGIPFEVSSSELNFGRRTVTHEYPQRDMPYVEDMGKAIRKITIKAFVCGSDYVLRSKRLIACIEKQPPETGGDLVHPWLGKLKVFPVETPKIVWNEAKRIATLELVFVEAGELQNPTKVYEWASQLFDSANAFFDGILKDLHVDEIAAYTADVAALLNGGLATLANSTFAKFLNLGSDINNLAADLASLLTDKDKLKDKILSDLSISYLAATTNDWQKITSSASTASHDSTLSQQTNAVSELSTYASEKETAIKTAAASVESAVRQVVLGNAIASASYIGTDYDQNDEGTRITAFAEDVLRIRDNLLSTLEDEMLLTGVDDEDLYTTQADAYSAVYNQLTSVATSLGTTETVTPSEVTSSLALAYEKYEDASRDLEIVQRNNIANPLFVPTTELKIASD